MIKRQHIATLFMLVGICSLAFGYAVLQPATTHAQDDDPVESSAGDVAPTGDDSYCLTCHLDSDAVRTLPDGTTIHAEVDASVIDNSVHEDLGCVDCHGVDSFPHDDPYPATGRAYTVQSSLMCINCHEEQSENLADDVHTVAISDGNLRSASCVDCHGAHDVQPSDEPVSLTSETCGDCHTTTFDKYRDSVHGEALFDGDGNAPTCTSCHGVHGIQHPTTALFRNRSPQLCATCHADAELMAQYDISTQVFDTYLDDFHGTTVSLFEQEAPNVPTNKAVCTDCHGVHDITRADDSKSQVVRENLLATCQDCHPGASADFPDTWVGHFEPTFESHPLVYLVNLFYSVLIPVVMGAFIALVLIDIFGRIRRRMNGGDTH